MIPKVKFIKTIEGENSNFHIRCSSHTKFNTVLCNMCKKEVENYTIYINNEKSSLLLNNIEFHYIKEHNSPYYSYHRILFGNQKELFFLDKLYILYYLYNKILLSNNYYVFLLGFLLGILTGVLFSIFRGELLY